MDRKSGANVSKMICFDRTCLRRFPRNTPKYPAIPTDLHCLEASIAKFQQAECYRRWWHTTSGIFAARKTKTHSRPYNKYGQTLCIIFEEYRTTNTNTNTNTIPSLFSLPTHQQRCISLSSQSSASSPYYQIWLSRSHSGQGKLRTLANMDSCSVKALRKLSDARWVHRARIIAAMVHLVSSFTPSPL